MRDHFFVLCLSLAVVAGCQSETEVSKSDNKDNDSVSATSESQTANDVKTAMTGMPDADDTPDQVCRFFMNLLQSDDAESANRLFTRKAQVLTMRYDLPLAFPGEADDSFTVGEAKFATSKEELAQVVCEINGTGEDASSSEIGWMLKRESKGWRICGMLLTTGEDDPMEFISFENVADLDRVKSMLSGDPSSDNLQETISPETVLPETKSTRTSWWSLPVASLIE